MSIRQALSEIDFEASRISRSVVARRLRTSRSSGAILVARTDGAQGELPGTTPVLTLGPAAPVTVELAGRTHRVDTMQPPIPPSAAIPEKRSEIIARRLLEIFGARTLKNLFGRR